jgi:lysophospholipase L1-like esterase
LRTLSEDCSAQVLYVALGDSTVAGEGASRPENSYPSRLERRLRRVYPNARLINLGIGGAIAADVVGLELPRAVELQPHLVTLSIGPNDINDGYAVDVYAASVRVILEKLANATDAVIVVNLMPDMSLAHRYLAHEKARISRTTMQFNHALENEARRFDVEIVDLYGPSRALGAGAYEELLSADGFHPSDLGYERWAEFMWIGIEARLGCEDAT